MELILGGFILFLVLFLSGALHISGDTDDRTGHGEG
jgi:hypothetical protein